MGDRTCAGCGAPLSGRQRKWCAESCRMRVWHAEYRDRTGEGWSARYRTEQACVDCGESHRVDPKRWEAGGHRRCGRCARAAQASSAGRASRDARRQRLLPVGPVPRRPIDVAPPVDGRWWSFFVAGFCSWCDGSFLSPTSSWETRGLYCSGSCRRAARDARRGSDFRAPPRLRQEIYERDGWVCQLCEEPVNPDLDSSDLWAATLDHLIPRSHTLVPDDSPANLQLAHRWCNSVKGDLRFYSEDVLKVG